MDFKKSVILEGIRCDEELLEVGWSRGDGSGGGDCGGENYMVYIVYGVWSIAVEGRETTVRVNRVGEGWVGLMSLQTGDRNFGM